MSYPTPPSSSDMEHRNPYALPESAVDVIDEPQVKPRRVVLPILLFVATCISTFFIGGPIYSAAVMFILLSHELGHYVQARRYRVPASLPFFIPVPLPPLGTMGAVIGLSGQMPNRRALFDIGISGPLAGLVPALICSVVGLHLSYVAKIPPGSQNQLGDPLLFQLLVQWIFGPLPPGHDVVLHPLAYAAWVGVLVTSINLFPIGQLDGGHILYAILREKAHLIATGLLFAALAAVIYTHSTQWSLMIVLLLIMGPRHAPTENDDPPLGAGRTVLGWLTLAFVILGFTPKPFGF